MRAFMLPAAVWSTVLGVFVLGLGPTTLRDLRPCASKSHPGFGQILTSEQMARVFGEDTGGCALGGRVDHNGFNTTLGCGICKSGLAGFPPTCTSGTERKWVADVFTWFKTCGTNGATNVKCKDLGILLVYEDWQCQDSGTHADTNCNLIDCNGTDILTDCVKCTDDTLVHQEKWQKYECEPKLPE